MRVLQISSAREFGGGERHLVDLTRGLTMRGHDVFVALRVSNEWEKRLGFLPRENFIHLPLKNSLDVQSARRLAKFVFEKDIDVIHAHVARDYPIAALASFLSKKPFVITRHLTFTLNVSHRLTLKRASRVIAVSNGVTQSLSSIVAKDKISVIYNGIDTQVFENAAKDKKHRSKIREKFVSDDEFLIATVGELREHKGQEDFINAAAIIAEKYSNAKFLIVGQDNSKDRKYQSFLKNLVENLNLKERVVFTGLYEEMPELYAAIDIFVSAARSEPFGLVITEAMASGLPVVATQTVGAKEIIVDDMSGRLAAIKDSKSLAAEICGLIENFNLRSFLGKNAQDRARSKFSLERMTIETENAYLEIVSAH